MQPSLTSHGRVRSPHSVILMLHGGQQHGHEAVDARSLSWLRSRVMASAIAGDAARQGVAVRLLRYRHRGWNAGSGPVEDARWGLEEVRRELGELPVVLLGHSMGARTSVHAADHPLVRGVVALAPWLPPGEPVRALAGRELRAAHGRADRITSYAATAAFVERARGVASHAELTDLGDAGHYMVRRSSEWNAFALDSSLAVLS